MSAARRLLALAHFGWGLLLLALATWFAASAFQVLPHMSTGTAGTNLLVALLLAAQLAVLPGALGLWMLTLGRWTWSGHTRLRTALLVTHGLLLLPGALAFAGGVLALRAGAQSAERGGGLLSPLGALPLAFGGGVLVLALCSTFFARGLEPGPGPGQSAIRR